MGETHLFISNSESKDVGRLFLKMFLFVPLLLFVAAVNVSVDPAGLYRNTVDKHNSYEYQIVQGLAAGKDVSVLRPIDFRLFQKYFIESLRTTPDVVVLGSSRSMWLGENIFTGQKVINNSVSDPVLADYLGIFEEYAKKNLYPKRVILVLDPQLIIYPMTSEGWLSIKEDSYTMLAGLGIHSERIKEPIVPQAWLNIFSFSYFQESVRKWKEEQKLFDREEMAESKFMILKDGRFLPKFFAKGMDEGRSKIIKEMNAGLLGKVLRRRIRPDGELESVLESFIAYLTAHHVEVTLCLLPAHPQFYQLLLEQQKRAGGIDIVGIEQYYRDLAQRQHVDMMGSYDPAACGLGAEDFYDRDHIKNDVLERMLKQKGSACSMPGI